MSLNFFRMAWKPKPTPEKPREIDYTYSDLSEAEIEQELLKRDSNAKLVR